MFYDGRLVGSQGFSTRDFLITRIGETGSWLGREFHGIGIGTAMRKVICAFIFDYLGAKFITSSAYADNPASLGVSRKCGYRQNGVSIRNRMASPHHSSCSYSNLGTSYATNASSPSKASPNSAALSAWTPEKAADQNQGDIERTVHFASPDH